MKYREYGTEGEDDENRKEIKEHSTIQEIFSLVFQMAWNHIWMHWCNLNDDIDGSVVRRKGG